MINLFEVAETNEMIAKENLDVRTITLGISLLDCIDSDLTRVNERVYQKITTVARDLVKTGEAIEKEFGIPIVNKRISVTPIALVGGAACKSSEDFVTLAKTLDRAAREVGVNLIGGYSALVSKGMTKAADSFHSRGVTCDGKSLQLREPWFHQNRYQYGRGAADGRYHKGNRSDQQGAGQRGLYEAGCVL